MLLSGNLSVYPIDFDKQLQPASIDVRLSGSFQVIPSGTGGKEWIVNPFQDSSTLFTPRYGDVLILGPGEFALGSTIEHVRLPADVVARVEGKSSLARLGIAVHVTAGFIDPGFSGQVTLELANLSPYSIKLTAGMQIAQLSFEWMDLPAEFPYGHQKLNSKYQHQRGATGSHYYKNSLE